ncbi:MAG: SDR family oxidoreductase [Acidimicrobiales bacterium]
MTGSTSGLGKEIARACASEGARIAVTGRNIERGEQLASELTSCGAQALFIPADLRTEVGIRNLVERCQRDLGTVTVLVNNAVSHEAIDLDGTIVDVDRSTWQSALSIDVLAAAELCKLLVPGMVEAGRGSIVNITAIAAEFGRRGLSVYSSCKAALTVMAKQISADFGRFGVRANVVQPGYIRHEIRDADNDEARETALAQQRLTRMVEPHDVAMAVVYLASREAEVVTGVVLPVDAGTSCVVPTVV